jgi:hypothetical protein
MDVAECEQLVAWLRDRGQILERQVDLLYNPPGAHFAPRYGIPPRVGCRATRRDGRPCAAHAAIVGASGYCRQMQAQMRAANERAIASNPASATYTDTSPAARRARLMATWDQQHQGLKRIAPALYGERRKAYEQSIGAR